MMIMMTKNGIEENHQVPPSGKDCNFYTLVLVHSWFILLYLIFHWNKTDHFSIGNYSC